jgi:hypothetical protein
VYTLILRRLFLKQSGDDKIKAQLDYLVKRGLGSNRGKNWTSTRGRLDWSVSGEGKMCEVRITFQRNKGRTDDAEAKQWDQISTMIAQTGSAARFTAPWFVWEERDGRKIPINHSTPFEQALTETPAMTDVRQTIAPSTSPKESTPIPKRNDDEDVLPDVQTVQESRAILGWGDLAIRAEFLSDNSDDALANDSRWGLLYGVNPQIRVMLGNVQRAIDTDGESRQHMVLYGPPGSGKTTTTDALIKTLGEGAVLKLDATSTTKAGLEKLFFKDLANVPPIVVMEEIEKADEGALAIWLGALDTRGEIRKVNFKTNQVRKLSVLFICTVNNKAKFEGMLAGALDSRCCTQIYFPRPNDETLRQILAKEIRLRGGKTAWIEPAIQIAKKLKVSDPRIVSSFLAGGDRLLDGSYQKDWLAIAGAKDHAT